MQDKLTPARFYKYRQAFERSVDHNPTEAIVLYKRIIPNTGFEGFTGNSERVPDRRPIKCLYTRDLSPRTRTKYGLAPAVNGILYVPHVSFIKAGIPHQFKSQDMDIELHGILYMVNSVIFRGPYYGSYISAEIRLQDPTDA